MNQPKIRIEDYTYELPDERIAKYPLSQRDHSKLLIYNKGIITQEKFSSISSFIPEGSMMVFNNTKVVPARLFFKKDTGALIEIFCLEPVSPSDYSVAFACDSECSWKTIIGNVKKWKGGYLSFFIPEGADLEVSKLNLKAELLEKQDNSYVVRFFWDGEVPFSKVLELCGQVPIPPYLNRETEAVDLERYQTLYAKFRGSVAAPTAGLHFTEDVLGKIKAKGVDCEELCLHVGAGTFLPVKSEFIEDHVMHSEPFSVTRAFLQKLYDLPDGSKVISVGTTSTRSLESLYYAGCQCLKEGVESWVPKPVRQWDPYQGEDVFTTKEAIKALVDYMTLNKLEILNLRTQIIIVPSYNFKVVDILVTNFHQPQSTLLLLISAFVGGDDWKKIYGYAMENGFRFLSYGDSSMLVR
jgi:S-adenosylmethionine:tRNA ribosyltransferase-isomerase